MQKHNYPIHPAAELFPMMSDEEFKGLVDDMRENGQRESIVLWKNQLIDGRNRLKACEVLEFNPQFEELDDEYDPWKYVISHNLHRRHLSTSQRSMVSAKLASLKRGDNQHTQICESSIASAAKQLNVSERSVVSAKQVIDKGSEQTKQAVEQDRLPVSLAADLVKAVPDKKQQDKIIAEGASKVREIVREKKEEIRQKEEPKKESYRLSQIKKLLAELLPHELKIVRDWLEEMK